MILKSKKSKELIYFIIILIFYSIYVNENILFKISYKKNISFTSLSYFQMWYKLAGHITERKTSIAILRYGDGESSIMNKRSFASLKNDKFYYNGGVTRLGIDLNSTLKGQYGKLFFYCIPFYSPLFEELYYNIEQKKEYIYSANIFVNYNYNKTKELIKSLIHDEYKKIILLCNKYVNYTKFAEEVIYFPNDIIHYYEKNYNEIILKIKRLCKKYTNRLFAVSVGPLSEILIWYMFNENPNNRYVDFGSSIDEIIKQRSTRRYTKYNSKTSRLIDPYFTINNENRLIFSKNRY